MGAHCRPHFFVCDNTLERSWSCKSSRKQAAANGAKRDCDCFG